MNMMQSTGLGDTLGNLKALHTQMVTSSALDTVSDPQSIVKTGGSVRVERVLRKKILGEMPKSAVEQKGGRMVKKISVGGKTYKCTATKVGKTCRYEIVG